MIKAAIKRITFCLFAMILMLGVGVSIDQVWHPIHYAKAQVGPTTPFGFVSSTNLFPPTSLTGAAGTVTNTSGLLMQVDGGPIYCSGSQGSIAESNITLSANTTFLIVFNCPQELVYAKQAVTGPGTSTTSPGTPSTLLYPVAGVEIPLATVVCGASTCATITDSRPIGAFPSGAVQMGTVTFANLPATFPNGAAVYCSNCLLASSPCTGASTGALALRVAGAWRCQ